MAIGKLLVLIARTECTATAGMTGMPVALAEMAQPNQGLNIAIIVITGIAEFTSVWTFTREVDSMNKSEIAERAAREIERDCVDGNSFGEIVFEISRATAIVERAIAESRGQRENKKEMNMERTGKYNRGHREGCESDIPEGFYGNCCSCEWLDHIDKAKNEGGFHWKNSIYFKRLRDQSVRMRIFGTYNGTPNYTDSVIPPNEWASIVSSVSHDGETAETYRTALTFHAAPLSLVDAAPKGNENV